MTRHFTRKRVAAAIAILLLLLWWLWPDGNLARVQALQKDMANESLTPDERREKGRELRAAMEKLSPNQRSQMRGDFQKRMEDRMKAYFAMSPAEKTKYLDAQINQQQQMTQQGPPPGAGGGGFGGGGPGGGAPKSNTPEDKERRRQQRLDNTSPEFRAQMDQFRKDMEQRRQQRGLPATPPGRPGR